MVNLNKLKINPINNYSNRFQTKVKTYKRLLLLMLVFFITSSYITAESFGRNLKEDRIDFKETITNYLT